MKLKINNEFYEFTLCNTFFSKFKGLMFSKKKNLLFSFPVKTKPLIHMFFVFYPITIITLDESYRILEYKYIYPFQLFLPKYKVKYILEIPKKIEANKVFFIDKAY
ncbi:hypothetical protein CL617_05175 [archaeon]|nr:hypothetical protein [archaeon]|tara:strand:+ start:1624 stop:1941 length:318 start_codon:yes stop_codon:yes gene_type:complete